MMMLRALIVLAIAITAAGCGGSDFYRARAFVPAPRHYRVRYLEGEEDARRVLPASWAVRGFRVDGAGRPGDPNMPAGSGVTIAIDVDGDGDPDVRGETPRFDLHYEADEDGAELWATTVPLSPRLGRRSLAILARELVEGVFGAGFVTFRDGRARAYETVIVDETEARVGGAPAYVITFQIAQVPVAGSRATVSDGEMVTLVLVRPGRLLWRPGALASTGDGVPMLIVLGLDARADRHALHRPALDALLDRLDVRPDAL